MDATLAGLIGAGIGAVTVLASSVINNTAASRVERVRLTEARRVARVQTLRDKAGIVFAELFAVQHLLEWVAFFATHDPDNIDMRTVTWVDEQCREAWSKVFGALAMVAALDLRIYEDLRKEIDRFYDIEGRVTIVLRKIETDRQATVDAVAAFLPAIDELLDTVPRELARIMAAAEAGD